MGRILIADDDREIAALISDALTDEGFETVLAYNGQAAMDIVKADPGIDLIILDIMMPKSDGLAVCRRIRDTTACPILFVTAKKRVVDTLLGLEMGADDYITKPFVVDELVARVKAHLRRESRAAKKQTGVLKIGEIEIHKDSYEVFVDGKRVELSTREFQLLLYLSENAGKVLEREQIFSAVWGQDYGDIGTVAVNIKNLRDKLDRDTRYIKTVWGVGYKMVIPATGELQ